MGCFVWLPDGNRARISLPGAHQAENAAVACRVLMCLREAGYTISAQAETDGLANARWPARLEWSELRLLIDGAHNLQAVTVLCEYLDAYVPERPLALITGMMKEKDATAMAALLEQRAVRVYCVAPNGRAIPAEELAGCFGEKAVVMYSVEEALQAARDVTAEVGTIVVAGSLYLAGQVRDCLSVTV